MHPSTLLSTKVSQTHTLLFQHPYQHLLKFCSPGQQLLFIRGQEILFSTDDISLTSFASPRVSPHFRKNFRSTDSQSAWCQSVSKIFSFHITTITAGNKGNSSGTTQKGAQQQSWQGHLPEELIWASLWVNNTWKMHPTTPVLLHAPHSSAN